VTDPPAAAVPRYSHRFDPVFHNRQDVELVGSNYRSVRLIDEGVPLPQQDNYLAVLRQ
jgi:hypothetical protein